MASKTDSAAARPRTAGPAGLGGSHKSFQSVLPCGNKLLQRKWDQTYYDQHKMLVRTAKPMVDSRAPPSRPHLTTKWKKQQLEKERYEEIDRDNMTLLKKMQHIMKTEGNVEHHNTYRHHSLNEEQRRREMERVAKENRELLKRLQKVGPMYRVSDWINDWQRKEELTSMITSYPVGAETGIPLAKKIKAKKGRSLSEGGTPEDSTVHVKVASTPPPDGKTSQDSLEMVTASEPSEKVADIDTSDKS